MKNGFFILMTASIAFIGCTKEEAPENFRLVYEEQFDAPNSKWTVDSNWTSSPFTLSNIVPSSKDWEYANSIFTMTSWQTRKVVGPPSLFEMKTIIARSQLNNIPVSKKYIIMIGVRTFPKYTTTSTDFPGPHNSSSAGGIKFTVGLNGVQYLLHGNDVSNNNFFSSTACITSYNDAVLAYELNDGNQLSHFTKDGIEVEGCISILHNALQKDFIEIEAVLYYSSQEGRTNISARTISIDFIKLYALN